jgi:hypothetical protein
MKIQKCISYENKGYKEVRCEVNDRIFFEEVYFEGDKECRQVSIDWSDYKKLSNNEVHALEALISKDYGFSLKMHSTCSVSYVRDTVHNSEVAATNFAAALGFTD